MKLSLLNKQLKDIIIGSIIKSKGNYPFGIVTNINIFEITCFWYKTLEDLKNNKNKLNNNGVTKLNVWNNNDIKLIK